MNPIFAVFRAMIAIPATIPVWFISFFGFHQSFLMSSAIALGSGALVYWLLAIFSKKRFLKKHGLTRKEYQYIKRNLNEAKPKIYRLHKALLSIRHLPSLKERIEFTKITRKLYTLARKEPKRFYQAEPFFFSHLDSAVELAEKYVFLAAQPKKTPELEQSLNEAFFMLENVSQLVEQDLFQVLSNDIDRLDFEIDVAKHSLKN
ncbi:5-bromo-4-chloroindolyl phosphate hydrolysis family protein [Neobacillus sp. SM06]|uniref:5-bromo-4-chloroindolyl phosphate hydrolysis family protein n=1 Tax=Neobacillus sp. SM06 TaxID=3422492 RepID=UPI003D2C1851